MIPEAQVIDIRNAITFLQGEPGVDATRIGVVGIGLAGAHVVAAAANDARVKAGVAIQPWQDGKGVERRVVRAVGGAAGGDGEAGANRAAPATEAAAAAMNAEESKLAFAEYQPFRYRRSDSEGHGDAVSGQPFGE